MTHQNYGTLTNDTLSIIFCVQRSDETEEEAGEKKEDEEEKPDPLKQLITCLSRAATKEQQSSMPEDVLYISYAQIMSQVSYLRLLVFKMDKKHL